MTAAGPFATPARPATVGQNRNFPTPLQIVNNPLIATQQWKLWLCALAVVLIGICQFAPPSVTELVGVPVRLLGIAGGGLMLVVAARSIRCSACGLALVWHGMRRQPAYKWPSWVLAVKVCPQCGFSHGTSATRNDG